MRGPSVLPRLPGSPYNAPPTSVLPAVSASNCIFTCQHQFLKIEFSMTLKLQFYLKSLYIPCNYQLLCFIWNLEIEVPPKYGGTFTVHLWQYHLAFSMTCLSFNPGVKILLTESVRKGGVGQGWVGIPISREYKPQIFLPFPWHFKFPFPFPGKGSFGRELGREILSLFAVLNIF